MSKRAQTVGTMAHAIDKEFTAANAAMVFLLLPMLICSCRYQKSPGAAANYASDPHMVFVPAGFFLQGAKKCAKRYATDASLGAFDECPQRRVFVSAFLIGKYEVTVAQYSKCVESGNCDTAHLSESGCPDRFQWKDYKSIMGGDPTTHDKMLQLAQEYQ
jgi:formylglycine-generating enzyme required for sulfatase activity